uniref:30S ribosomal protein S8 n=1 Tax=Nephromyces sp. ex Molgula occidentalis TaxID=2544991 RepID=A0A5C1H8C9_9APIC|nr:30S ribosomal protein S8 [Nephromyces sp. ex Molgula occidentalis]
MNHVKDLLNKIKLWSKNKTNFITLPVTNFTYNVCYFLKLNGYINNIFKFNIEKKNFIIIQLTNKSIKKIEFFNPSYTYSYIKNTALLKWVQMKQLVLITTSKGIFSASTAYKLGLGGKLLCSIIN